MKSRTIKTSYLTLLLLLGCVSQALAHQQKAGLTRIVINERTQSIEVMHRFNLHDAEHAVGHMFGSDADIHASKETQRQFARHVVESFSLKVDGEATTLDVIGAEVDGKHVWVYQEMTLPESISELNVRQSALHSVWADQENLVNVEGRGPVQSRRFKQGDAAKRITLPAASDEQTPEPDHEQ